MIYSPQYKYNLDFCSSKQGAFNKIYAGNDLVWEKVLGNFLLWDKVRERLFTTDFPLTYPKEMFVPIAIVLVPFSHNRYGTKEAGFISLKYPSRSTPDEGQTGVFTAAMGMSSRPKKYYAKVGCCGYLTANPSLEVTQNLDSNAKGNLPYNVASVVTGTLKLKECPTDSGIFYCKDGASYSAHGAVPSPFLENGGPNKEYGRTTSPTSTANCTSDFWGKENCENFLQYMTSNPGWEEMETLPSSSGSTTYSPAVAACWRYHTLGTKPGDWYIPSAGELGYLSVRIDFLNKWIEILANHFEVELARLSTGYPFWSSTYYDSSYPLKLNTYGQFQRQTNSTAHAVRPFMRGYWEGQKEFVMTNEYKEYLMHNPATVDLGLPSRTIWSKFNVGAWNENEIGLHFQWGDIKGYDAFTPEKQFTWNDYPYCVGGTSSGITKYYSQDLKTTLELMDDMAYNNVNENFVVPSTEQIQELVDNCETTWIENPEGNNGMLFTSKINNKTIFFPAGGNFYNGNINYEGTDGFYWSNSLVLEKNSNPFYLYFEEPSLNPASSGSNRCRGLCVKPVLRNI